MHTQAEIFGFLQRELLCSPALLTPDVDMEKDLGCTGDDMDALVQAFSKHFSADCTSYRPVFHREDEGMVSVFRWVDRTGSPIPHIPVTPALLLRCANARRWIVNYPSLEMPRRRLTGVGYVFLGKMGLVVLLVAGWLFRSI